MHAIIRYVLLTAKRDMLLHAIFAVIFLVTVISQFFGACALVEQSQMATIYFAGSARVVVNAGMIIFVAIHIRRLFETREIEQMLARPISRTEFVLSYFLSFLIIGIIITLPLIIILSLLSSANMADLIWWYISLNFELFIVISFALLSSLIMSSPISAIISSCTFYIASRLSGYFIAMIKFPIEFGQINNINLFFKYMGEKIILFSTIFLPRFDLFTKSNWLIYGTENDNLKIIIIQFLIYIFLMLAMAIVDLSRKEF